VRARLATYRTAGVDRVWFVPIALERGSDADAPAVVERLAELRVGHASGTQGGGVT
jgi:hypothetical protein